MLSESERRKLQSFAADCADALGHNLLAVLLHGDAASPRESNRAPLSTTILVDEVTLELLDRLASVLRGWNSLPPPLLLDREYLASSCDVFPLEILELAETHLLLWGDADPLSGLSLHREHLRLEIEQQLKGKLLHLRQAYLGCGGDRGSVVRLMIDSSEGFEIAMRGLAELAGGSRKTECCEEMEPLLGLKLETFRTVQLARRAGRSELPGSDRLFATYLAELTALVRVSDGITKGQPRR